MAAAIRAKTENNILVISLEGRIDSSNAPEIEADIAKARSESAHENIILDAEKLEYISSAGLRIILRLRKDYSDIKIINVSSEVYDIFDMTGFAEMINIEKAYRRLSVDGCEVIGRGANGEVYRLDPDTIIKVYLNPDSLPDIHRERELARRAFVLGIPTAIPYDVVRVGSGYGSVFELLNAKSFTKILAAEPERLEEVVGMYIELLKKIHSTEVMPEDMPDMKAVVIGWVDFLREYLPEDKWQKLHDLVDAVPESHFMLHGDYHTKNVMLQNGEYLLIDMDTLAQGDPVFEFASMFNAYLGFSALDHSISQSFLGLPHEICEKIWARSLELYFETEDKDFLKSVEDKASLIGYTRLMRRSIRRGGLGSKEVLFYKNEIISMLDRVDTLKF